ncbi:MAG TPA: OsmC family protein, partial [Parapedobacter sp.]|nr:OsmC family protein [Parapedobacter sp.]
IDDMHINVEGERRETIPNVFTRIHITFTLKGAIDLAKAEKAAELAVKKYCSVHDMLAAGGIDITYDVKIG